MNRKQFLSVLGAGTLLLKHNQAIAFMETVAPQLFHFTDDGIIPNNPLPLLLYTNACTLRGTNGADWLEQKFASNNWTNSWRWGVYPFHHYHSNTHEVLGVFSGNALLHLGGEQGEKIQVKAGDIIVIPAGVGHKCISHSEDFTVVGAYPGGMQPDLNKGLTGERPGADKRIAAVPFPQTDPFYGNQGGLIKLWK